MNINKLLIILAVLVFGLILSFFAAKVQFDVKAISILLFLLVFIPTLIHPDIGLVIIIVSMLFSPDLILGRTTAREITVRIEDIFLLVVILAVFIRMAFTKDITEVFKTKLTTPFFLYIAVCVISTLFAFISPDGIDLKYGFFSIAKYLEYFLLFLIVKANLRSLRQIKMFVAVFLLVALLVSIHSNLFIHQKIEIGAPFFRTSPPVETRGAGQAGTLGGYLVFMMAIAIGLLLYLPSVPIKVFLICLLPLMFRGFLYTLSRGSYLALFPTLFTLIFFSRKIIIAYVLIMALIVTALFLPSMIRERIIGTVIVKESIDRSYLELEESPRGRLESWKLALFEKLPARPIFGYGVGKLFIDSQIFLTLTETGIVGLTVLLWILLRLFKMAKQVFNTQLLGKDEFGIGLSLGFLAGYVGLLVQGISTNTFIIIRIMEPFWFIAAIVLSLPELIQQEESAPEQTS